MSAPASPSSSKRIPRTPPTATAFLLYVSRHCPAQLKRRALLKAFFISCANVCDLLTTWVLGRIVGTIVSSADDYWGSVFQEILILAAIWTARNIALRLSEFFDRRHAVETASVARELLFNRLIEQGQEFLQANFSGVLANHVRRAGEAVSALLDGIQMNIIPILTRFGTAGILLWQISPLFALFLFVFVVLACIGGALRIQRMTVLSQQNAEASSKFSGYVIDSVTNLSLVRQNAANAEEKRRMQVAQEELRKTFWNRSSFRSFFWGIFDFTMTFFICGFMLILAYAWQSGSVSVAQLSMCVGLVMTLFGAIANVTFFFGMIFEDIGTLRDALGKISTPLTVMDDKGAPDLAVDKGIIEFRDVSFGYKPETKIFDGLNLTIPAGQKVGFVGVSGAGKTTLCQLLLRAYDVTGGGIYIDGQNISKVTQDSLHESIAVIPQDPSLFHRTLGENIHYGRRTASDEEIKAAAHAAEAGDFIESQPLGYDTLVGERGIKLSGGQRQRVAIARAILKKAPILVLDEATSALDSETEQSIQKSIAEAMKGRTTLVIAHRLSTLRHMDRLIVMEQGRIVEDGSFEELLAKKGIFYRLWSLQAGGFLPDHLP